MIGPDSLRPASTSPNTRKSASHGATGRVAEVHHQTRRGLLVAAGFVVAAIVTGVTRVGADWWLPLHLFVVGALLSAVSTTTQMLAVTWSTAPAPPRTAAAAQRWALAVGAVTLVVGRETDRTWLFVAGGTTVVASMIGLTMILLRIRHQALNARFKPAIEVYVAAVVAGTTGMSIGLLLGSARAGTRAVELRDVHLTLNVFGLIGLVIAGTLPYFAATQLRSKMSPRATPLAMRVTFALLVSATAIAAIGHLVDQPDIAAGGLVMYVVGLSAVVVLLPTCTRRSLHWAGTRLAQLAAGIAWWAAMTVALAFTTVRGTDDRSILRALVIGGFGQILVASLAYLGPVLRGGGHERLTAGFATTRSWVSVAAGNVAAAAALFGNDPTLAAALSIWVIDITIRAGHLLTPTRSNDHV